MLMTDRVLGPFGAVLLNFQSMCKSGGDKTRDTALSDTCTIWLSVPWVSDAAWRPVLCMTESSRLALADIRNRVGKAVLVEQERVAAIHSTHAAARARRDPWR